MPKQWQPSSSVFLRCRSMYSYLAKHSGSLFPWRFTHFWITFIVAFIAKTGMGVLLEI